MQSLSNFQISAANDIVRAFQDIHKWCVLSAQMQSGKTDTFYLVAFELLRLDLISHVVVLSGSNELELKQQVKDRTSFVIKYKHYLQHYHNFDHNQIDDVVTQFDTDTMGYFTYLWSNDIKKHMNTKYHNTLFIWEESHFAQSLRQLPSMFLSSNGISGDGSVNTNNNNNNNRILSVSATGFSEQINLRYFKQPKQIITLKTGSEYFGVKEMMDQKLIIPFSEFNMISSIKRALHTFRDKPLYAVIRAITHHDHIKSVCINADYNVIEYNTKTKKNGTSVIQSLDELQLPPHKNTVVLIKGMCRMGKQIPKTNISFVMETSMQPNTDTILQGLLGRMCGYHQRRDIPVIINESVFEKKDIIAYIDNVNTPSFAMNLSRRKITNGREFFHYSHEEYKNIIDNAVHTVDDLIRIIDRAITDSNSNRKLNMLDKTFPKSFLIHLQQPGYIFTRMLDKHNVYIHPHASTIASKLSGYIVIKEIVW